MSEQPDDLRDLSELYALGLLDEPELTRFREALASGSGDARRILKTAMETNAVITSMVPLVDPPRRLRNRVLASAGVPVRHWSSTLAWVGVAAALLVGVFYYRSQEQALEQVRRAAAQTAADLRQARHVLSFLNAPDTRLVTFGPEDPKPPRGRILLNPSRGILLIASNLPPAPPGRIYEMWVIPTGAPAPIPAGTFQSDAGGNAVHMRPGTVDLGVTVAVTMEPEGGSQTPTMPILFAASL